MTPNKQPVTGTRPRERHAEEVYHPGEIGDLREQQRLRDGIEIELPLIPRTFYCVGLNYLKHLKEAADKRGEVPAVPDRPEIGYRAQNALIAHDEEVVIPPSRRTRSIMRANSSSSTARRPTASRPPT